MSSVEVAPRPAWIKQADAARNFGLPYDRVRRLVRNGTVTTRRIPGLAREILAADLEKLLSDSVVPARRPGA